MNIFVLHSDPVVAAKMQCDKHVVKMILETAQLLSTAHHVLDGEGAPQDIYKSTHKNHPCAVWVRESFANYEWAYRHLLGLLATYKKRYGKRHKTIDLLGRLAKPPKNISKSGMTPFAQAMPDQYKDPDPVKAYRQYYIGAKREIAVWKHTAPPDWFITK